MTKWRDTTSYRRGRTLGGRRATRMEKPETPEGMPPGPNATTSCAEAERLAVEVTAWEDTVTRRRASLAEAEVTLQDLKDRLAALPRPSPPRPDVKG